MSDRGSGSGGHRRSDRLAKGKSVIYAPESPPDTDDEYDAMEDVRTRVDASLARDLQAEFDAEAAGLSSSTARPSSRPGITIGRSARPSSAPRQPTAAPPAAPPARSKRRKSDRAPLSADPIPEDHVVPGFRYPPQGGIRPRYPVTTPDPPESIGRGGWSEFSQLLDIARPEYRDFLVELGFGPFLSIRYVHVRHPLVRCWVERFFHHTGTIHLSTCEVGVLPVDWSAILGIRFGGRIPPSDPVSDFEALEILGIDDPAAIRSLPRSCDIASGLPISYLAASLGMTSLTIPTPIVGMFRDIDDLRDYDWGALTYGFYIRGLRRFSRRETASFLGFWQFTLFWAFEHFAVFAPSRLPAAPDSAFPLARRWDSAWIQRLTTRTLMECRTTVDCIRDVDIVFQPYSTFLLERPEVFRAMELSRLRIWIRSPRSWELLMGERTLRQLGGDALVPVDPPQLMTIEDYIPRAPSDSFVAGVEAYPALILADVPYREWFEQVSLGSLMSLHEVEGGRVMGGSAMDSHLSRSSGEFEWLQTEILRLQLELSVSEDRYAADMARAQEETVPCAGGADAGTGGADPDAGGLDPESEGFGFSGCDVDCSCGDHSETRGSASWHGHYSCYWSWLVWSWSDFFFAAPRSSDETLVDSSWRGRPCRHRGVLWSFPLSCCFMSRSWLARGSCFSLGPDPFCFSVGEVDLVPTMEEYAELLQLDRPFSEAPVIPIRGPRSNRCLEKYLGLTTAVLRPEIARPEETWLGFDQSQHSSQRLPVLINLAAANTKYFSRSGYFSRDRERGTPMFCTQLPSSSGSAVTCGTSTASRLLITLRGIR
uniref:Aminotransferase-like plant mobile domain-containing protein n=1 Tax=Fagus sylvatica TaxID=28930 RepID=A0A2N9FNI0_FAGSY